MEKMGQILTDRLSGYTLKPDSLTPCSRLPSLITNKPPDSLDQEVKADTAINEL